MENKTKTNDQAFSEYYTLISTAYSKKSLYEAKRILGKFQDSLGQFPPTTELAVEFINQFKDTKLNTRARYLHILGAFFHWYNGEKIPLKIRTPKILPQYVRTEDIQKLIDTLKGKKSHKKSIDRDILIIETAVNTGLRRGELAELEVGDLHLTGDNPVLIVRGGKGAKDRAVSLNSYICNRLNSFLKGKSSHEKVFGLAPKTISLKIAQWSRKAGVPLHTHSFRHYVGTTLFERGANPRAVQEALGHESLDVTMRYASVTGQNIKQAMRLLEPLPTKDDKNKKKYRYHPLEEQVKYADGRVVTLVPSPTVEDVPQPPSIHRQT